MTMATLSTHVLDTSLGKPAPGIVITLERDGNKLGDAVTDQDGRARDWGIAASLTPGAYRLVFWVGDYFGSRKITAFYSAITIDFIIRDDSHHHVPLLLSPFGCSTYRGS
jgi:5-hydroxyisourate hydrolase